MMDTFIKQILNISAADEWLHNKGLGWLISDRMLETASIIIGSFIIYFIGKYLIKWVIHYTIRSTAKHRSCVHFFHEGCYRKIHVFLTRPAVGGGAAFKINRAVLHQRNAVSAKIGRASCRERV